MLCVGTFLVGSANGLVEIGINPLAATLYPTEKTHRLNMLHAWWPGGMMLGGLLAIAISWILGLEVGGAGKTTADDDIRLAGQNGAHPGSHVDLWIVCSSWNHFPLRNVSPRGYRPAEMLKEAWRPMFLLWAFCMMLTAATELAPQGMQSLVLEKTAGMNGTTILIYTSLMMFVLRHFAGPIAHRLSPVGMLTGSAVLSAIGLYALSFAYDFTTAIAAATIFGLGITYFWPTMLGVTAERFPRGGAFLLGPDGFYRQPVDRPGAAVDGPDQRSNHVRGHSRRTPESDRCPGRHRSGQGQGTCPPSSKRPSRKLRRKGRNGRSAMSRFCL